MGRDRSNLTEEEIAQKKERRSLRKYRRLEAKTNSASLSKYEEVDKIKKNDHLGTELTESAKKNKKRSEAPYNKYEEYKRPRTQNSERSSKSELHSDISKSTDESDYNEDSTSAVHYQKKDIKRSNKKRYDINIESDSSSEENSDISGVNTKKKSKHNNELTYKDSLSSEKIDRNDEDLISIPHPIIDYGEWAYRNNDLRESNNIKIREPCRPRNSTRTLAIPAWALSQSQMVTGTDNFATSIARWCTIFGIDEIVVYDSNRCDSHPRVDAGCFNQYRPPPRALFKSENSALGSNISSVSSNLIYNQIDQNKVPMQVSFLELPSVEYLSENSENEFNITPYEDKSEKTHENYNYSNDHTSFEDIGHGIDPDMRHNYNEKNALTNSKGQVYNFRRQTADAGTLLRLLAYMETPQYLRQYTHNIHPVLKGAARLPSLAAPHHLSTAEVFEFREAVCIAGPDSSYGYPVDIGLNSIMFKAYIDQKFAAGTRCTVRFSKDCLLQWKERLNHNDGQKILFSDSGPLILQGTVVNPRTPVLEGAVSSWGYSLRYASSLYHLFSESSFNTDNELNIPIAGPFYTDLVKAGKDPKQETRDVIHSQYDCIIGTSQRGEPLCPEMFKHNPKRTLIMLGCASGLEPLFQRSAGCNPEDLCDIYTNLCEEQASGTIRLEEAVALCLSRLRPLI